MGTSNDHPELAFVQASGYTRGRADGPPLWIVVHDMEASEYSGRAESTAEYFATGAGGRSVSSHYCCDDDSVVQCVDLDDVAWTVGNRPGNYRGINWEFAGFARQTIDEWLDPFGRAMFGQAAPIIRSDSARFHIPLVRCAIADLLAFRPGVTSHNDLRIAFGVTDHTDPGGAFPWGWFIQLLNGGDMPLEPADLVAIWTHDLKDGPDVDMAYKVLNRAADGVGELLARPAGTVTLTPEDRALIVADLVAVLTPEMRAAVRAELDDTRFVGP